MAIDVQWLGAIYDGWEPDPKNEGVSVFLKGYEPRSEQRAQESLHDGRHTGSTIPYRDKIIRFFGALATRTASRLKAYFERYDASIELHLGASKDDSSRGSPVQRRLPHDARLLLSDAGNLPRRDHAVPQRGRLKEWLDGATNRRRKQPNAIRRSFYWVKNGGLGEVFPDRTFCSNASKLLSESVRNMVITWRRRWSRPR
jgi:hypothetical protein